MNTKQFYTIEETADILRVSNLTIYRNAKAGLIPSVKVGGRVLIPSTYFQSLIETALESEGGSHE